MSFVTRQELKNHLNLTPDDIEFDNQLPRFIAAAQSKVVAYCNRGIFETLPAEPEETDILVDDTVKVAILDIAAYYFDAKGQIDSEMIANMLDAYVGHLRVHQAT